ncbi:MAG: hypothetical protein EPO07_14980 [Verrucomicrobia bacterium]|nr:MAG: hypothetical protein EPO07_14980 [Verrucomicrobiota bacterium]
MKAESNRRIESRATHPPSLRFDATSHATRSRPIRLLTAVPICDGHDSAISTINLEFVRRGLEVVYLGYHRSVRDVVRAAIQEDARAIGLSSYNGGHVEFFSEVLRELKRRGAGDIGVFGGGGGTITADDAKLLKRRGVDEIFFAGTPLDAMVNFVKRKYATAKKTFHAATSPSARLADGALAKCLTAAENGDRLSTLNSELSTRTLGVTGPGGAGKTTLIDELALRFLSTHPAGRLAVLSHDPSLVGDGALLGDRATMIYAQDDRVFMRSLATRGHAGGVSRATARCLDVLRHAGFDLVIVETVGVGQEALPFRRDLVDKTVLVMSPDYGSRLQLQKIAMLDAADLVVVNKSDLPGAKTAAAEIRQRLEHNQRGQRLIVTMAKRHRDPGVDNLFREVMS